MSGCRSAFCTDLCESVALCRRIFADTRSILLPVLLSIALTQAVWVGIYECKVTRNIFFNDTNSIAEGIANAAMAMGVIAFVSGLMITLAIWHFKRTVKSWLALSCVVCSFVIAGTIFQDGAARLPFDEVVQLAIGGTATAVYGGGAVLTFFTKHLSASCHQLYVVSNIFAVLAPMGPLKLALERSQDYGADDRDTSSSSDSTTSSEEDSGITTSGSSQSASGDSTSETNEVIEKEKEKENGEEGLNAREALNTGSHLGFGDFIFYSILVGTSMAVGTLPALSSTLGVLVGLAYTLSIPSEQETLPALPISIIFGMAGHFFTVAQMAAVGYVYDYLVVGASS
uniref:Spe-4 n=1 Tax=Pristionchus pacificus TaxID=54126 RepID=A0A2A6BL51_PRIPA|eukprot:PDM66511.1 spe-4 [Pristionchus pacificus]